MHPALPTRMLASVGMETEWESLCFRMPGNFRGVRNPCTTLMGPRFTCMQQCMKFWVSPCGGLKMALGWLRSRT